MVARGFHEIESGEHPRSQPKWLSPCASRRPSPEVTAEPTDRGMLAGPQPLLMLSPCLGCLSLPSLLSRSLTLLRDPVRNIPCPAFHPLPGVRCPHQDLPESLETSQQENSCSLALSMGRGQASVLPQFTHPDRAVAPGICALPWSHCLP